MVHTDKNHLYQVKIESGPPLFDRLNRGWGRPRGRCEFVSVQAALLAKILQAMANAKSLFSRLVGKICVKFGVRE